MRDSDAEEIAARAAARADGIAPRQFVWVTARNRETGDPRTFGFWTGPLPITLNVVSGANGELEERDYLADGALLSVSKVKLTTGLKIKTASVSLSQVHPDVLEMVRAFDVRLGAIEIHRSALSMVSRRLVAPPRCRFLGTINGAKISTPKAGGAGSVTLQCNSDTAQLTRTNPLKRSDESQQRRDGDRINKYADVVDDWEMHWGEHEGKAKRK